MQHNNVNNHYNFVFNSIVFSYDLGVRPNMPRKYRHDAKKCSAWKGRWRQALRRRRITNSNLQKE